jgi:hypothetical protein
VIVPQKPSKPLLAANRRQHAGPFVLLGGEQQEVVLSLMVPLGMVMCRELLESSPERARRTGRVSSGKDLIAFFVLDPEVRRALALCRFADLRR